MPITTSAIHLARRTRTRSIFSTRDNFHMLRVNAAADTTQMIQRQTIRDGAFQQLPDKAMRGSVLSAAWRPRGGPVTSHGNMADPEPASCRFFNADLNRQLERQGRQVHKGPPP
jgi:hypothetical protein